MTTNKKNKVGRPLKYTLSQIQDGITAYFDYCGIDAYGYPLDKDHKPPTITGLACYLDTTRDLLIDYQNKPKFSDTIKRAKQRIEAYNEAMLYNRKTSTAGVIFNLKNNYGWKDKAEIKTDFNENKNPVVIYLPDNGRDKKKN